jgi:cell division protease FtsH
MVKESWLKNAVIWVALLIMFGLSYRFFAKQKEEVYKPYAEFLTYVDKGVEDPKRILEVTISGDPLRGDQISAKLKDKTLISSFAHADELLRKDLRSKLEAQQIPINYEKADESQEWWASLLTMWLPLILVVGFMILLLRNMQGAGGKALSFGKSKAKMLPENSQKITFKDVAGVEEAKQECSEIVAFLKDHKRFQEIGARIPKGVLMMGQPGTGKTLLARAIAGEAGVPFFHISGSDFVEMFVGVGASRVRDLFENAKKNSPCIVFIDEIDAVGRHRGAGVGGGHDEREQTLNQLLVEMDGFESTEAVIVIAATNRPDVLDPALLRPGRFDRRVVVNLPDVRGRKEILNVYLKRIKAADGIDVEKLALGSPGFSGADIENLCNEAALMAARLGNKKVSMQDFEYAKDKIMMGSERKSMVMSKELIKETAYHETGHALVSYYLEKKSNVHKLTVIPRGRALGATSFLPKEDIYSYTKEDLLTRIATSMGGRAAEEIKFSQFTTGAAEDIRSATEIARSMVCQYGMSTLGPINFGQKSENPFLGRDYGAERNFSGKVANDIDIEVSQIIHSQYNLAKKTLTDNMEIFERVSLMLIEVETLDTDEFIATINGASVLEIRAIQEKKSAAGRSDDNAQSHDKANLAKTDDSAASIPSPNHA